MLDDRKSGELEVLVKYNFSDDRHLQYNRCLKTNLLLLTSNEVRRMSR